LEIKICPLCKGEGKRRICNPDLPDYGQIVKCHACDGKGCFCVPSEPCNPWPDPCDPCRPYRPIRPWISEPYITWTDTTVSITM